MDKEQWRKITVLLNEQINNLHPDYKEARATLNCLGLVAYKMGKETENETLCRAAHDAYNSR